MARRQPTNQYLNNLHSENYECLAGQHSNGGGFFEELYKSVARIPLRRHDENRPFPSRALGHHHQHKVLLLSDSSFTQFNQSLALLQAGLNLFCNFYRLDKLVFPQSQDIPAAISQKAIHFLVSSFVAPQFGQPIILIVLWFVSVLRTTVPEATVHKNSEALFGKNEIWLSWQRSMSAPALDSMNAKDRGEFKFRVFVSC